MNITSLFQRYVSIDAARKNTGTASRQRPTRCRISAPPRNSITKPIIMTTIIMDMFFCSSSSMQMMHIMMSMGTMPRVKLFI